MIPEIYLRGNYEASQKLLKTAVVHLMNTDFSIFFQITFEITLLDNILAGAPSACEEIYSAHDKGGEACNGVTVPEAEYAEVQIKSQKYGKSDPQHYTVKNTHGKVELEVADSVDKSPQRRAQSRTAQQ